MKKDIPENIAITATVNSLPLKFCGRFLDCTALDTACNCFLQTSGKEIEQTISKHVFFLT